MQKRIYTTANYNQKDDVKELGGFFDSNYKKWYFTKADKDLLNHLLKNEISIYKVLATDKTENRQYNFNELKDLVNNNDQPFTQVSVSDNFFD
jgi:hypothetical protein